MNCYASCCKIQVEVFFVPNLCLNHKIVWDEIIEFNRVLTTWSFAFESQY